VIDTQPAMGIVGLGVMGHNLALNMVDKGVRAVVYDPWPQVRARFAENPGPLEVADSLAALVEALPSPRSLLIMVKAGEPVDDVAAQLAPLLSPGDTLIDGGNSHYRDTMRREASLREKGLNFIGLGVSGGEEGARHGPSLMAGGDETAYARVSPVLEAIAARHEGAPCCALVGSDGAGHFVKMVHNGIEYAVMQLISEIYVLLRDVAGLDYPAMARVFRDWNETTVASYLVEITAGILDRADDLGSGPLVEKILDKAGQKGTGQWSSEAALSLGVPTPTITEAVFARNLAARKDERVAASAALAGPDAAKRPDDVDGFVEDARRALLCGTVIAYAQGLATIAAAANERGWAVDLAAVAGVWRAGCIIRARLLDDVMHAFEGPEPPANLLLAPYFGALVAEQQGGWRRIVADAVRAGVPVPGLSSALAYYDGYRSARLGANLIQAQRDCFGAHSYERTDRPGSFHTEW